MVCIDYFCTVPYARIMDSLERVSLWAAEHPALVAISSLGAAALLSVTSYISYSQSHEHALAATGQVQPAADTYNNTYNTYKNPLTDRYNDHARAADTLDKLGDVTGTLSLAAAATGVYYGKSARRLLQELNGTS